MMFAILIPSLLYLASAQVPTLTDLKELKQDLINAYDTISLGESLTFKPLAGSVLRLIFHDCGGPPEGNTAGIVSKCDGCIAMHDLEDHANLEFRAIDPLDDIYLGPKQFNQKMSRSDFWAFAATVAVLHTRAQAASDGDTMPQIPYFFGREDCSTSPDVDITKTQIKQFPAGTFVYSQTKDWMQTNLGLNDEEIVAILGAHTIGRMHPGTPTRTESGFTGPWVSGWGKFDNGYYTDMIKVREFQTSFWQQKTASNGLKEWGRSQFSFFGMLNVDMSLLKDLSITNADGTVSCGSDIETCTDNPDTGHIVRSFASNNQLWLNTFVPTYIKMITAGYNVDADLETVFDDEVESGIPRSDTDTTGFRPVIWFESGVNTSPRKCLDVDVLNIDNNGATVQMWECNEDIQQTFYFEQVPNTNFVVIKSAFSGDDNCLDVDVFDHAANTNAATVQMWDCNFAVQQQWTVDPVTNTIKSSNGKCLDAAIETQHNNGGTIQLWECGLDNNGQPVPQQTWIMKAPPTEIQAATGGKCVDIDVDNADNNGARVQVWDCNDSVQQTFFFIPVPHTNFVVIKNAGFIGQDNCLDVHDVHHTSCHNPGTVQMWDCNSQVQQKWILDGNKIKSSNSNNQCGNDKCLDAAVETHLNNGGIIQLWDCNDEVQQTWTIHLRESSNSGSAVGFNYHVIPNENDKYYILRISEPGSVFIYGILIVLLICNVMACYINGKNKFNKTSKYNKIKYIDSDSDTEFVSS